MVSLNDVLLAMSNIPVDDPIAEIWGRGLQGGHEIIEYTGILPITINADGTALIDYRIYGNTVQDGAPTPENPVMPDGVGERVDITGLSEPLCGIGTYTDSLDLSTGILTRRIKKLVLTGEETFKITRSPTRAYSWYFQSKDIGAIKYTAFYCSHGATVTQPENFVYGTVYCDNTVNLGIFPRTFESQSDARGWLAAQYAAGTPVTVWYVLAEPEVSTIPTPSGLTGTIEGYLIQDGTPTPETPIYPTANGVKQADGTYSIPYGYKLPILSNSAVTNIYLGEVETTRRIKKLALTGKENWTISATWKGASTSVFYIISSDIISIFSTAIFILSDRFKAASRNTIYTEDSDMIARTGSASITIRVSDSIATTVADFKSYLAAQYAAGSPVTVWYVLAEPETGIVNEPLMKIGDYTDTLSMEQADVSIPTFAGATVIDYDGELKPSQMYIKYRR